MQNNIKHMNTDTNSKYCNAKAKVSHNLQAQIHKSWVPLNLVPIPGRKAKFVMLSCLSTYPIR